MVSSLPLKWLDFFPFSLLLNSPLSMALVARKIGWPLSAKLSIIRSAVLSHFPSGSSEQVPYHFFSDPGPKNDQRPSGLSASIIRNCSRIRPHIFLCFLVLSTIMSLYIDMKMILPFKLLRFTLVIQSYIFESLQEYPMWWILVNICHSTSIGSPSLRFRSLR